jgi:hypothetical protein
MCPSLGHTVYTLMWNKYPAPSLGHTVFPLMWKAPESLCLLLYKNQIQIKFSYLKC